MAEESLYDAALWRKLEERSIPEPNSGCLLWLRSTYGNGYGSVFNSRTKRVGRAHRFAWEAVHGPIPVGLHVLHKCDVPSCINPAHLFLGTQADNMTDKKTKKRERFGGRHGMAKLTDRLAAEIKMAPGPQVEIAVAFGISKQTVNAIKRGRLWRHV